MLITNLLSYIKNKDKAILLTESYKVDWKNQVVTIDLFYEKATEVIYPKNKDKYTLDLRYEVFMRISDIICCFPKNFKVNINLEISDYEGYDSQAILTAISSELELYYYETIEDRDNRWYKGILFLFISTFIILVKVLTNYYFDLDSELFIAILYDLMDVCSWVFAWIAIEFIFIPDYRYMGVLRYIHKKIKSISLYNVGNNDVISKFTEDKIKDSWKLETAPVFIGKIIIIVSLFVIWVLTMYYIGLIFDCIIGLDFDFPYIISISYFATIILGIVTIFVHLFYWKSYILTPLTKRIMFILFLLATCIFVFSLYCVIFTGWLDDYDSAFVYWTFSNASMMLSYLGFKLSCITSGIELSLNNYKKAL